jgi:hypothetical protein
MLVCWKIAGVVGLCKQMELKSFSSLAVSVDIMWVMQESRVTVA